MKLFPSATGALLALCVFFPCSAMAEKPFEIAVVDAATGRGVPLVELETMDNRLYVTDSAGRVAFAEPGQMGVPVWFSMRSHGYEFPSDGFGMTGMRFTPRAGERGVVKAKRLNIAERVARLTGQGIYRDTVLLGEKPPLAQPLTNGGVVGQDSVQAVSYKGRIFWLWGDTMRMAYPLGNFRTACAWSEVPGKGLAPSQGVDFHYYVGADGFAKEMCPLERKEGVVWLFGLCVVRDDAGAEKLVAHYSRRGGLEKAFEHGIAVFNDEKEIFERAVTLPLEEKWRFPRGRATAVVERGTGNAERGKDGATPAGEGGTEYIYFGDAGLCVRVRATLKDVCNPASYEAWTCLDSGKRKAESGKDDAAPAASMLRRKADGVLDFAWRKDAPPIESEQEAKWLKLGLIKPEECRVSPEDPETKKRIHLHEGSVCWNEFRKRWVLIAVQQFGKPSFLGEVWYAESASPTGPWKRAVKIVTHDRYSFYNPAQHPFFDEDGGRTIYFEGTYAHTFSGRENRTPLYDYNQILYRLDLDDPRLRSAQE